jgi:hypothetical protein
MSAYYFVNRRHLTGEVDRERLDIDPFHSGSVTAQAARAPLAL